MIVGARKLIVDGWDLSGHVSGMDFGASVEMQDDTVFGDAFRSNAPGLEDFAIQHEGVWSAGAGLPDTVFAANKGLRDVLATLAPVDGDEGEVCYFMRTTQGIYSLGGSVGDLLRFSVSLSASGGIGAVRGTVMANATLNATDAGTAFEMGAVGASAKLYAGLHVLSASGTAPTLDVVVESDDAEAFLDPVTRITFGQKTAIGSEWATPVGGALTDDWWRVSWTLGGTAPSFDAVVVVGIQ